jgi:hypothetical protein
VTETSKPIWKKIQAAYVLFVIYGLWLLSLKRRDYGGFDDFDVFFNAGKRLLLGENIYGEPHIQNLKYFYSVFFAGLLSLLQGSGVVVAKWIWFLINFTTLFRLLYIFKQWIPQDTKWKTAIIFMMLLLCSKIILINFVSNQMTIFILWTVIESYMQLKKDRLLLAALVLCLGINIKILPIVVVPYFIYISSNRLKFLIFGVLALMFYTFIPAVFIGWDYNWMLIGEWLKTLNPVSKIHVMQTYEYGILDISSMITKYLSDEPVYLEPKLNVASWTMGQLFALTNFLRVSLLAGAVFLAFKVKKSVKGLSNEVLILSAFLALAPLCFPHQREYSFLFYSPLWLSLMVLTIKSNLMRDYIIFGCLAVLSGLLTWVDFVGNDIVDIFNFYRITTLGMFCMFVYYVYYVNKLNRA